ncbi:energy-coupling factor transporter transmembrane component T [Treponema phagedenis]|uniref:energy-coupling factor transporter transmembrane component T n=1 Tax=Treponema phagedenis TaxID=162 RepID=UPI0001F637D9|nr:energy-coupling factor transporter transmembrane component T [Treponema phagedenis]EFW36834.1 cobalt transport protein [Treponema phagedenis F0421]TYT78877.1 energy-coupling factor transporter transmembrane protein EcfT [Treponema phagedenis]
MKKIVLDPRTKLFLTFCMGLSITVMVPLYVEVLNMLLLAFLFFTNGQVKSAIKLMLFFLILVCLSFLPVTNGFVSNVIFPITFMIRRFMLPIVAGKYLIDSTPVGLLMSALEKLKLPQSLVITISVMLRFFPTLSEEYTHIKNAMKMRGIGLNASHVIQKPLLMLEYVMVPLLASASRIGDELAASAHIKGVDAGCEKVRYKSAKFSSADVFISMYIVAGFVLVIGTRVGLW